MSLRPILPGSTIGVLGSGQLGRMFTIAARRMGYRVHTYSPETDTPTGQVADLEITAPYEDLDAVRKFSEGVQVVTFEFENVPADTASVCAEHTLVRPNGTILHITQHRLREKQFLMRNGFPIVPFRRVSTLAELEVAIKEIGTPAILKTAGFGYDGKGQFRIDSPDEAAATWLAIGEQEAVLEKRIDFHKELSVVAARSVTGQFVHYGVLENDHRNSILDVTMAPANIKTKVAERAVELTRNLMNELDVVGVLCVEFFLTYDGQLRINELAPRPHNSGHFSFDASVTSQFEQQLRAVCGLPLGSTELLRPAAMVNLLGDLWDHGEPNWAAAAQFPNVKIHVYGKLQARPGRKMGHLTALASTAAAAKGTALAARNALGFRLEEEDEDLVCEIA